MRGDLPRRPSPVTQVRRSEGIPAFWFPMPTRWEPRHTAGGGRGLHQGGKQKVHLLEKCRKLTNVFRVEIFLENKRVCALHIYRGLEGGNACEFHILNSNMWSWCSNVEPERSLGRSHRLGLILKDLPGLLLVAQLLDAFPLQVARLALLEQRVGPPVPPQELGGCARAQDLRETCTASNSFRPILQSHHLSCGRVFVLLLLLYSLNWDCYSNWSQLEFDPPPL